MTEKNEGTAKPVDNSLYLFTLGWDFISPT